MTWFNKKMTAIATKLNPAQPQIQRESGDVVPSAQLRTNSVTNAYKYIEVVNKGVNLIVDLFAMVDYDVKDTLPFTGSATLRREGIRKVLNFKPNPYQDISSFRRALVLDFLIQGDAFIYFDGVSLYHLPAASVEILTDSVTFIKGYRFMGTDKVYNPDQIIHIKENNPDSLYRGWSRVNAALDSLGTRENMVNYQNKFFENGIAPGMIFVTDQAMSPAMKERLRSSWESQYNPTTGAKKPMILDAGLKPHALTSDDFKKMDHKDSVTSIEEKALAVLGVPPILLNSGNNANIRPNIDLLFNLTIIPMVRKFVAAFEAFFAYDIAETTYEISALAPDAKAQSDRLTALVNNGIMLGKEAREELRLEPIVDPNLDKIRIPANVAGSASGVSGQEGGKPSGDS